MDFFDFDHYYSSDDGFVYFLFSVVSPVAYLVEFTIRKIEDILMRNKILKPTKTEEESETEPKTSES